MTSRYSLPDAVFLTTVWGSPQVASMNLSTRDLVVFFRADLTLDGNTAAFFKLATSDMHWAIKRFFCDAGLTTSGREECLVGDAGMDLMSLYEASGTMDLPL